MAAAPSLELIARDNSILRRVRERLPTYWSDFREDPRWLLMFIFGRTSIGGRLHKRGHIDRQVDGLPLHSNFTADRSSVVSALSKDGIFDTLTLPVPVRDAILRFANTTGCFGNHDRNHDLLPSEQTAQQDPGNLITSGHYFERIEDCPEVMAIQSDQLLHAVARDYLGPNAQVISTRLWWSFSTAIGGDVNDTKPTEMLHFDLDDWRMLKFFFYLTPVDAGSGPHLYMRGTHRHHALKHQLSLTVGRPMDEVISTYGGDRLMRIYGAAGSGFAEDPFGFHAGSLASATDRLMLEIGFGITPPNRRRFFGERVLATP
jgi:hypothetical protein